MARLPTSGDSASRMAILGALAGASGLSRTELSQRLGVTPATITGQVRKLKSAGLLHELDPRRSPTGRPRVPLALVEEAPPTIGIIVTPNHAFGISRRPDGTELAHRRIPFNPVNLTFEDLADLVTALDADAGQQSTAVGVGISGVVDQRTGAVIVSVVMDWVQRALGRDLSALIDQPVYVENDVRASAVHELAYGTGDAGEDFILVSIGSGVGMAIVTESRLLQGSAHTSSEFGHMSIDASGARCRCGNIGCLDMYAGRSAILEGLKEACGLSLDSIGEVASLVAAGYGPAQNYLATTGEILGRAVGGVATLLGVGTVVVTGESVQLWPALEKGFHAAYEANTPTLVVPRSVIVREWTEQREAAAAATVALSRSLDTTG